ncbi:MAG: hypothetical protein HY074_09420 [Deltaproteobacteria bacterium]|nr:hypothetical protein [Deltaproteobacteria bacterium]
MLNFRIVSLLVSASTLALSSMALAQEAETHSQCNRTLRYESLDEATKTALNKGDTVTVSDERSDTEFHINYILKLVDTDAELIQAVFTSYAEQKEHLKSLKESTVEETKGNTSRIRYEADTGHWYVPNSHYTVNDIVTKEGATYMLNWNLVHSEGLTKLTYIDGYMRTEPVGSHALILYCNYIIPDIKMSPDQVNREGMEGLKNTVEQAVEWVAGVAADHGVANEYLTRYRQMLGQ